MVPRRYILAHRGLWGVAGEPNSPAAIHAALDGGFGIETDVRDHSGVIVVSHDPPLAETTPLSGLLAWTTKHSPVVALNVKADGLAGGILEATSTVAAPEFFVFDMSLPQARAMNAHGLPTAARVSEFEPVECLRAGPYSQCSYLWLDCFDSDWFIGADHLPNELRARKTFVVSPEVHGRDPEAVWIWLLRMRSLGHTVGLCTDLPLEFDAWQNSLRTS